VKRRHLAQVKDLRQRGIYRFVPRYDMCLTCGGESVQEDRGVILVKSEMQRLEIG